MPDMPYTASNDAVLENSVDPPKDIYKRNIINKKRDDNNTERKGSQTDDVKWLMETINKRCGSVWMPQRPRDREDIEELLQWPRETIEDALTAALRANASLKPPGILRYCLRVIQNRKEQADFEKSEAIERERAYRTKVVKHLEQLRQRPPKRSPEAERRLQEVLSRAREVLFSDKSTKEDRQAFLNYAQETLCGASQ